MFLISLFFQIYKKILKIYFLQNISFNIFPLLAFQDVHLAAQEMHLTSQKALQ